MPTFLCTDNAGDQLWRLDVDETTDPVTIAGTILIDGLGSQLTTPLAVAFRDNERAYVLSGDNVLEVNPQEVDPTLGTPVDIDSGGARGATWFNDRLHVIAATSGYSRYSESSGAFTVEGSGVWAGTNGIHALVGYQQSPLRLAGVYLDGTNVQHLGIVEITSSNNLVIDGEPRPLPTSGVWRSLAYDGSSFWLANNGNDHLYKSTAVSASAVTLSDLGALPAGLTAPHGLAHWPNAPEVRTSKIYRGERLARAIYRGERRVSRVYRGEVRLL